MDENIKSKLSEAIHQNGQFFFLNETLNDELIYQTIFDCYFKHLTVDDIKEFVHITYAGAQGHPHEMTKLATFNIKLITNFTLQNRIDILNDNINKLN